MRRYHGRSRRPVTFSAALIGAVLGVAMFFGSFALLWWNEGRTNLAELARAARVAQPERVDPALDGALISVTAPTAADEPLADPEFLRPGPYLALERRAEMFAWIEHARDHATRASASSTAAPAPSVAPADREYSYTREWTATPPDSSRFRHPRGHENPPMRVRGARWTLAAAALGAYRFSPAEAQLPSAAPLALTPDMLVPHPREPTELTGGYVFVGRGTLASPVVGDVRWTYAALATGAHSTLFGAQQGAAVRPHHTDRNDRLYRLLPGTRDAAIAALALEHRALLWLLRLAGMLSMWLGMNLVFGPANAILDIIPPLGRAGRGLVAALTLPVAAALSFVTVLLAVLLHTALSTVLLALLLGALVTAYLTRER